MTSVRSRAPEMEQGAVPTSFRTCRSSKSMDRKPSPKEETNKAKRSPELFKEFRTLSFSKGGGDDRKELLEEVQRVKESESKMLDCLALQTKQLEQTKIELEEAKLEVKSLHETIKEVKSPKYISSRTIVNEQFERGSVADSARLKEEIVKLKHELKLALGAEEKSKKAMDDLAIALKEVATDANRAKAKLSVVEKEAEQTKSLLKTTEEKLKITTVEVQRLKMEAEESQMAWNAKQDGFRDCVRLFEEEISCNKNENRKLLESQRTSKDDNSKLRDILKHAVNEATIVKEALEIARSENSQLKDTLSERDNELAQMRQELELLKGSRAAPSANPESRRISTSFDDRKIKSESFNDPVIDVFVSSEHPRARKLKSFGGLPGNQAPMESVPDMFVDDFEKKNVVHFGEPEVGQGSPLTHKKKKPVFRKFTDIMRKSFPK